MKDFGKVENRSSYLYTIENNKFIMSVCDYGATLVSFVIKEKNIDIIQGFDSVDGYVNQVVYMGATIGRVCNRIKNGEFELDGIKYKLNINNGPNSLHGGINGFNSVFWDIEVSANSIICKYFSKDGEEGYPGNLNVKVVYSLMDDGLRFEYEGISDKDTLFSLTNHAFFNFYGPTSNSVLEHELVINANHIGMVDENGQTLEELMNIVNTPFDFRNKKKIGIDIDIDNQQLINGNGYDHHYVIEGNGYRKMLECYGNKIKMNVYSDLDGFHLYSGNFLDGKSKGKFNGSFPRRSAVCFETQYYPNSINYSSKKAPILKANILKKHLTDFTFEWEE